MILGKVREQLQYLYNFYRISVYWNANTNTLNVILILHTQNLPFYASAKWTWRRKL